MHNHQQDRQKKWFRVAAAGVLVALTSVVVPGVANAAILGAVQAVGNTKADVEKWGAGWDACRDHYPATQSIRRLSEGEGAGTQGKYAAWWQCWDTPRPGN